MPIPLSMFDIAGCEGERGRTREDARVVRCYAVWCGAVEVMSMTWGSGRLA